MTKCYACRALATVSVTVPPLSMIPEVDEFQINFKKGAISIPACNEHILNDGVNEIYFRNVVHAVPWNNVFAYFQSQTSTMKNIAGGESVLAQDKKFDFSTLNCNLDFAVLNKYISLIARALFFHEKTKIFTGQIKMIIIGFLESQYYAMTMLKSCFNKLDEEYPKRGKDKQIFFYQIATAREIFEQFQSADKYKGKGLLVRMVFYEGSEFYVLLE